MKKDLIIEMEEECIDCPRLELETRTLYLNNKRSIKSNRCIHTEFCQDIIKNLKAHGWRNDGQKEDESHGDS